MQGDHDQRQMNWLDSDDELQVMSPWGKQHYFYEVEPIKSKHDGHRNYRASLIVTHKRRKKTGKKEIKSISLSG